MRRLDRLRGSVERHPTLTDGAIAAVLCGLALLTLRVNWQPTSSLPWGAAVGLTVLLILPLTWRRRFPLAVLAVVTPLIILHEAKDVPATAWAANAWWLALFGAGAYGSARWRTPLRAAAVAALTGLIVSEAFLTDLVGFEGNPLLLRVLIVAGNAVFVAWIWWFGDVMRIRREREAQLAERTLQLEREREANARRAVLDERMRIARELHDVVAHHVSLMGVQAGAGRRVLAQRPEQAAAALSAIEAASRQAVLELHRLLGFLRQDRDEDENALAPPPSLRQLDALVAQMRDAGLPVSVTVEGGERLLPPSVDLSAYRIVQEALTNTLKHAGPATAAVTLRYGDRALDLEVVDDGRGPVGPNGRATGGNGLVGMGERVGLLGGRLEVGHHPGVGFSVRARLPLDGRPA